MFLTRRELLTTAVTVSVLGAAAQPSYAAGTTVNVSLWDRGADTEMVKGLGLGMGGDMSNATMGIAATPEKVKAGEVAFIVTNASKDTIHEMIVARIDDANTLLPYIDAENRVDEDATKHLGEVSELEPGASGSLTYNMKPGLYLLYCNIPGHYVAGMWTLFTVE
jgi:uncharacterized cupredoxin-like copper-binding protein